jgi:hypothetical protein
VPPREGVWGRLAREALALGRGAVHDLLEEVVDAGGHEHSRQFVLDWHGEQIQRIAERGIEVLIPPDTSRRRTTRRNWDGGRYDEMREALATERGSDLYRTRQPMIEPALPRSNSTPRGPLQTLRARRARTEWRLITATHSLLG